MSQTLFTAGPRLSDTLSGDPERQAIDSLRGYSYQLYAAGLAWIALQEEEDLYLEVAEDYAVAAKSAVEAVQVKDTANSGTVTINSAGVLQALDSFVDLQERNPSRQVTLRYLTTARIGKEKKSADRLDPNGSLVYWRKAATASDVAPLRDLLLQANTTERVKDYVSGLGDAELREQLLRRVFWDCGQPDIAALSAELRIGIASLASTELEILDNGSSRLEAVVIHKLLMQTIETGQRKLTANDLRSTLQSVATIAIPEQALRQITTALAQKVSPNTGASSVALPHSALEEESQRALPVRFAERQNVVAQLANLVREKQLVLITGSTGMGKTLLARMVAHQLGGRWKILDLQGAEPLTTTHKMDAAIAQIVRSPLDGLIVDDLVHVDRPEVARCSFRLRSALERRDAPMLATLYRQPSTATLDHMGIDRSHVFSAPSLDRQEVSEIISAAGADPSLWTPTVHRLGGFGHPQLVQAAISGLSARNWPKSEVLTSILRSEDVSSEREETRRQLVDGLTEQSRNLLARLSLVIGRFDRTTALKLGEIEPKIQLAGEQLDALIGPWIDKLTEKELRVSPLVSDLGTKILPPTQTKEVHTRLANELISGQTLDASDADLALLHALVGEDGFALFKIAFNVIAADFDTQEMLAKWMTTLRFLRTDQPIYPNDAHVSVLLRLAQLVLLLAEGTTDQIGQCWSAMESEYEANRKEGGITELEPLILAKTLLRQSFSSANPTWVQHLVRFMALIDDNPEFAAFTNSTDGAPDLIGFIFLNQAMGTVGVQALESAFEYLGQQPAQVRNRILQHLVAEPTDATLVLNHAWLQDHKREDTDWHVVASAFANMAEMTRSWGHLEIALRCLMARVIILDEYLQDSAAALQALDEAKSEYGANTLVTRSRAKVLYRRKDHEGALILLRDAASDVESYAGVELAFMFREAAISAAETENWAEARTWFLKAREAADHSEGGSLLKMSIGLAADGAVAAHRSGDTRTALQQFGDVLGMLAEINPEEDVKAAYVHRVVSHAIAWLAGECNVNDHLAEEEAFVMPPGGCSNPEPPAEIVDLPLAPLSVCWYLLANAEQYALIDVGIMSNLETRLPEGAVAAMEIMLRIAALVSSIKRGDTDAFPGCMRQWIDAKIYLTDNAAILRDHDPLTPVYSEIPPADASNKNSEAAIFACRDAMLMFAIHSAIVDEPERVARLQGSLENAFGEGHAAVHLVNQLVGEDADEDVDNSDIAGVIKLFLHQSALDLKQLFMISVRIMEIATDSDFKRPFMLLIGTWICSHWVEAAENQRFLMRSPARDAEAIQSAASGMSFQAAASTLLIAEEAISTNLDNNLRERLKTISRMI